MIFFGGGEGRGGEGGTMQLRKTSFIIEDHVMKSLKSYRYLGVTFKHNLLFDKHVQMVKDVATKADNLTLLATPRRNHKCK